MQKNIEVIPYLSFKGSCEEALNTYIEAYGAKGGGALLSYLSLHNLKVSIIKK